MASNHHILKNTLRNGHITMNLAAQEQIDRVIQEILTRGIPQEPERIAAMLIVLRQVANLRNERMRFAVCQLQQDLVQIAKIYQDHRNSM